MAQNIATLLDNAGIDYRRVTAAGSEGFLLTALPDDGADGIRSGPGLFLIASNHAAELANAASPSAEIVESGTLSLGGQTVPVHRYKKPGEAPGGVKRRAKWFQQRLK